MDADQLAQVLDALDPEWRLLFHLLAATGLRIGELLELRWRDIDLGAKRLRVRRQVSKAGAVSVPKTRTGLRDIPLSTVMCRRLWKLSGAPEDALLFASSTGRHVNRRWLARQVLDPATEAAGVPWVTFHTFRHTCASLLFENGKSVKQVQGWLGHADPAFTLRTYIHLLGDDSLGDADFLDAQKWSHGATHGATRPTSNEANDAPSDLAESAI